MKRIQKVSQFFLFIFKSLLIILPILEAVQWLFIDSVAIQKMFLSPLPIITPETGKYFDFMSITWSAWSKFIGFSADIIGLIPLWLSLFALISIFNNYRQGEIFNAINAKFYRCIGWLFILDGLIAQTIHDTLLTLAISINNPIGQRFIGISFGSLNIQAIFIGAIVIVISWVMLEANKLHDDQKYTI